MDYTEYLGGLLVFLGMLAQWLRASRGFSDLKYFGLCGLLSILAYLAVADYHAPWRLIALQAVVLVPKHLGEMLAGTQFVSMMANIAVKLGASAVHSAVPVTNSK
jgi:hypothetical protein